MSESAGETQLQNILGQSLSNTRMLVIILVIGIAILVGVSIPDTNLKVCFWLSLVLFIVAIINLNLAITFYIKLRNEKGIQGPRGERGDKGPKGFPGRCELNLDAQCNIKNCKAKVQDKLMTMCPHYKDMVNKRDIDRSLEEKKILNKYQKWISIIDEQCKTQKDEKSFFDSVFLDAEQYCLS